jgi:DNA-binding XRE family transcriptional regulator
MKLQSIKRTSIVALEKERILASLSLSLSFSLSLSLRNSAILLLLPCVSRGPLFKSKAKWLFLDTRENFSVPSSNSRVDRVETVVQLYYI